MFIVFKISFWWVSTVIDVFSTVYFRFRNYQNTVIIFVSENTVLLSFPMKKYESENGGVFCRSFPTVFIPKETQSLSFGPKMETIRALEARLKYLAVQSRLKPISSLATKKRSSPIWYGLVYPKFKLPKLSYWILRHLHEKLNINKIKS